MDSTTQQRRLQIIKSHLVQEKPSWSTNIDSNSCAASSSCPPSPSLIAMTKENMGTGIPNKRQKLAKWNGWGYKDTDFTMDSKKECYVTGDRYVIAGKCVPNFRPWFENFTGLDTRFASPCQSWAEMKQKIHKPNICEPFIEELRNANCFKFMSFDDEVRLMHSHGHCCQEIYQLRFGKFKRLVDVVVYPNSHEHVEKIVAIATKYSKELTLIPYGGGTNVTQALLCPENETRMIVSVDLQEMNKILNIDFECNTATIQAGAIGIDLQKELKDMYNLTLGHEPDSIEFSSLGGWVATRASGMKKNLYGNIEDMLVNAKIVTPKGTWSLVCNVPRKSTGPDLMQLFVGSEGTLGIVTEVTLRVRKHPDEQVYGSVLVPDFEAGVACLHEVANRRVAPASIRLIDNSQFQFGQSLKPKQDSKLAGLSDWFKGVYVTKVCGFDPEKMCVITLLFEGSKEDVERQQKIIYEITAKYGGLKAGAEAGHNGYLLTYVIAYLRDYGFNYYFMSESFETSAPWSSVVPMIKAVEERVKHCAKQRNVPTPWVSARVTQVYETGACIYFYYGFIYRGLQDPIKAFSEIEAEARDEILLQGGSLSHHHGIGKLRREWMNQVVGDQGVNILKDLKNDVDPDNLLGNGNFGLTRADLSVSANID